MITISPVRQKFDVIIQPSRLDLRDYRIRGQSQCPPLLNLLIIGSSIGLFAYVNTFFIIKISKILDGTIYNSVTQTFSCETYYCDQTAFNFINFYTNYQKCNFNNCVQTICFNYQCNDNRKYGINYYYACQPKCGPLEIQPVPIIVKTAFVISIVAASSFGFAILLATFYGIFAVLCSKNLLLSQKMALLLNFTWPNLKYYMFLNRQNWQGTYINLKWMVILETIITFFYAISLIIYLVLQFFQFWQTPEEIACFYLLIWATAIRITLIGQTLGPFLRANRQINQMRTQLFV